MGGVAVVDTRSRAIMTTLELPFVSKLVAEAVGNSHS